MNMFIKIWKKTEILIALFYHVPSENIQFNRKHIIAKLNIQMKCLTKPHIQSLLTMYIVN